MRQFLLVLLLAACTEAIGVEHFPEADCYLYQLREIALRLQKNDHKKARELIQELRAQTPTRTFKNGTGRHLPGIAINASDVKMKLQKFVLAACPRNRKAAKDYYEATLDQNVTLFVSAIKSNEAKSRYNNFWTKKRLKKIALKDKSKIVHVTSKVLCINNNTKHKKVVPQIIETTLETTSGKTISHLHYDGWRDKRAMPCLQLFSQLLDRIYELNPDPKVPIAINCRGGVGRTGTIAVSLYLRRLVDAELAKGVKINDIKINIPEIIYTFRRYRKRLIGNPHQLAQIYSSLADYYERVAANSSSS